MKPRESRSKEEAASYTENFLLGQGSSWDWDDFMNACGIESLKRVLRFLRGEADDW